MLNGSPQVRQEGHDAGGDIGSTSAADERLLATVTTDVDNGEGNEAEKNNNNLEMRRSRDKGFIHHFFLSCGILTSYYTVHIRVVTIPLFTRSGSGISKRL